MYFRAPVILSTLVVLFALGCGGGKAYDKKCDADARTPWGQCPQSKQCPSGQTLVSGECRAPVEGCPTGYSKVDGRCQSRSFACPPGEHEDADGACVTDQLTIDLVSESTCWIESKGAMRVIVQYTVRDESGRNLATAPGALGDEALPASFYIDNEPMDLEAQLRSDSELLSSDLMVSLVLDASSSMLLHEPPAFEPMKLAAIDILQETQNLWAQTEGSQFYWQVLWFDSFLFSPADNMAGEPWSIEDIARIPQPADGTYTALYKAINKTIADHEELYQQGIAAGSRDQHVMLILSDGDDNQYHVDNPTVYEEQNLDNMLFWTREGGAATDLAEVKAKVEATPYLRTHVIGFGPLVNSGLEQTLKDIASAGRGQYFYGDDASTLDELFREVQTEFVTLQTLGAEVPLPPAEEYTFSLIVNHPESGSEGSKDFAVMAGPDSGACAETAP